MDFRPKRASLDPQGSKLVGTGSVRGNKRRVWRRAGARRGHTDDGNPVLSEDGPTPGIGGNSLELRIFGPQWGGLNSKAAR